MTTSRQKKRILIVDDEPNVVTYLEMLLNDHGFETVAAANGAEAMERVRSEKPDLVTLDISMPETSGVRFFRELKDDPELAAIPVVVVTAVTGYAGDPYGYMKFMQKQSNLSAPEAFFPKPIDKEEFLEKINTLLS